MNVMYLIERLLLLFSTLFSLSVFAVSSTKYMQRSTVSGITDSTTVSNEPLTDSITDPSISSTTTLDIFNISESVTSYVDTNIEYSTQSIFASGNSGGKWNVTCYNATINIASELVTVIECRCEGLSLIRIPQKLPHGLQRLTVAHAGLKILRKVGLHSYANYLEDIMLLNVPEFEYIEPGVFEDMPNLRTIDIQNAPKLLFIESESFRGISESLRTLRITNCGLLKFPDLKYFTHDKILHMVDLEGNQIKEIKKKSVYIKTESLILDGNSLNTIADSAFYGSHIAKLTMKNNPQLKYLHEYAFAGIQNILYLDLSRTAIEELPTEGLQTLEMLFIQNTHSLKTIPSVYNFQNLQAAYLTHPFHCCAFKFPSRHDPTRHTQQMNDYEYLQKACKGYILDSQPNDNNNPMDDVKVRIKRWLKKASNDTINNLIGTVVNDSRAINKSDRYNYTQDLSWITGVPISSAVNGIEGLDEFNNQQFSDEGTDLGDFHEWIRNTPRELEAICGNLSQKYKIEVLCFPTPDALNPCEDVMGSNWLRFSVWIVVLLAVIGNVAVLIVLFSNRSDVTVPKFLMSNLAFADFCMGLYLLLIAAIDAHSIGEYFNVAYDWQYGSGCKAAGFLTVFASHLSIFTLTIITLERWFAITYAIYLNKRIKIRQAIQIMIVGWIYSITMAALPLFGVSNYSSTSICLPMEARDSLDVSYLISVLGVNGLAFFIILICYAQIYLSLGKETRQTARHASRGEMTVAKKMALLVFTNFACWAPIAFFGLTAIAGYPLIDVAKSKILLVFFYPINSCANPYLYAILTSQYRRDLFLLLSKCGLCKQRAQQYKLSYSQQTTNQTYPVPLIGRNSETNGQRKNSKTKERDEAYV